MKLIFGAVNASDCFREVKSSTFQMRKDEVLRSKEASERFSGLRSTEFLYVLLAYGNWCPTTDIFGNIKKRFLKKLQNKEVYFIFDASQEGFSPFKEFPIFDILYFNCKKYNVDPSMIIYLSGNLRDEENIKAYATRYNVTPLNVHSFLSFESAVASHYEPGEVTDAVNLYHQHFRRCKKRFSDKFFSSLSRVNRPHRTLATFLLCQEDISKRALISHDRLRSGDTMVLKHQCRMLGIGSFAATEWSSKLPLIVDRDDFFRNWASVGDWHHIHDKTLFQIVNETQVEDYNNTSLFFSEKTFRPVLQFQPFVIYGQRGCNHMLKEAGYELYDDWFDLSFDLEKDPIVRYQKLLQSITKACDHLETLTHDEQVEWRFKNMSVLTHNFKTLRRSYYSKRKLYYFLDSLDRAIVSRQENSSE